MIPASRAIGAGETDLSTTDNILNIDTTLGAAIINLPSVSTWFELKNKSGAIYDADGLRYTDVGGLAGTNSITFVAADGEFVNGSASITINTNGASGVITPTLDADGNGINGWEASAVGAASAAGAYDVFGAVIIDNIFVESLDLVGLENIYTPVNSGISINIGGTGTIVETVSMPDLTEAYGSIILDYNEFLTSFSAPALTLVTGIINITDRNPALESINLSSLVSINGGDNNGAFFINATAITTLDLSALVSVPFAILTSDNASLGSVVLGSSLFTPYLSFSGAALTEESIDDILAKLDTAGFSPIGLGYDTLVGAFEVGEIITGGTSGATAIVKGNSDAFLVGDSSNYPTTFQSAETITGTSSGATANVTTIVVPAIVLTGGTSAAPSAAGLASIVSLEAKGWTISTN